MENQRGSEFQGIPASEGVVSPIYSVNSGQHRHNWLFDPYASDSSNSPASLVKRQSSADLEATESSSHALNPPVKVEEDVIIMDGIPAPRSNKGGGERRMSLPVPSYNSVTSPFGSTARFSSTLSPSGGSERRMSLPMSSYNSITSSFGGAAKISSTPLLSGGGERGMNLPMPSYDSTTSSFGRAARFSSISPPSRGGVRGSGSDRRKYEKQVCRFWEKSGKCRNGNLCQEQFAHEMQELNPLTLTGKRLDFELWKLSLEGSSSASLGKDYPPFTPSKAAADPKAEGKSLSKGSKFAEYYTEFPPLTPSNAAAEAEEEEEAFSFPLVPTTMNLPSPTILFNDAIIVPTSTILDTAKEVKQFSGGTIPSSKIPVVIAPPYPAAVIAPPPNPAVTAKEVKQLSGGTIPSRRIPVVIAPPANPAVTVPRNYENWSPLDSGIQVSLPHAPQEMNPSREDVDAYIEKVLYGASSRKRLPVFEKICPDSPDEQVAWEEYIF